MDGFGGDIMGPIRAQETAMLASIAKKNEREELYKQEVLSALNGIEKNTANLTEIISILHNSNDRQDEIFDLIVEILSIAKSKNQEEAESKYRQVMKKVSVFSGDVEVMERLMGLGLAVWTIAQKLMPYMQHIK